MFQQTGAAMDERLSRGDRLRAGWRRWAILTAIVAGAIAALAVLAAQKAGDQSVSAASLTVVEARLESIAPQAAFSGKATPVDQLLVTAQEPAQVSELYVREGDRVVAGQPLIKLSNPERELAVDTAAAQIESELGALVTQESTLRQAAISDRRNLTIAEYDVKVLENKLEDQKPLLDRGFIARQKYEATEAELQLKTAFLAEARQTLVESAASREQQLASLYQQRAAVRTNLLRAKARRDAFVVRARTGGIVLSIDAKLGQGVSGGQQLASIDPLRGLELRAGIDQQYLSSIRPGQQARAEIDGRPYTLTVKSVSPRVVDGLFEAVFEFTTDHPPDLRAGETILGEVTLGRPERHVTLPNGAFLETTAGRWLFVLEPGGDVAQRRSVQVGVRAAERVAVLKGLRPGEEVVVSDYADFADAKRLKIQ